MSHTMGLLQVVSFASLDTDTLPSHGKKAQGKPHRFSAPLMEEDEFEVRNLDFYVKVLSPCWAFKLFKFTLSEYHIGILRVLFLFFTTDSSSGALCAFDRI